MYTILIFAGLGLFAGVLLTVFSKLFEVKTDERVEAVTAVLPGINCGACGYAGCSDYAEAAVAGEGKVPVNLCKPGGQEAADDVGKILGIEAGTVVPMTAIVHCSGDRTATSNKFNYRGIQSCKAANSFYNGSESCSYGCLAFGDCVNVCPERAISIVDGLAKIDRLRCVGCGICTRECPNRLIALRPLGFDYDVLCSSYDAGKIVRGSCKAGCIGCRLCEKACPSGAIKVNDNLARIDYEKCTSCGLCAEKCPAKVIKKCG
ncbi:MAG: RnfABCDGE type electron transport complex subunit B [Ruminococcus sp.]|jgi:RnfABCDGE-type electron transport complex B subunit|nr:RnfABCDGE type electron transport complex subunit B [Ruminococcus sp.]